MDYADNCDSDVTLDFSVESGYLPTEDIANYCMPADGHREWETCDDRDPEAIRLFNFPNGESSRSWGGSSIIEIAPDSTMHILLETEDGNGGGFIFEATYEGSHDWNEWLACRECTPTKRTAPTSLRASRSDRVDLLHHGQWYHDGTGTFAGSSFDLAHQPVNAFYGLQIGEGANNKNENYGGSASSTRSSWLTV